MTGNIYASTYKLPRELQLEFQANSSHVGTAEQELWRRTGTAQCRTERDRNTALSDQPKEYIANIDK